MGEDFQAGVCGSTWWSSPRRSIGLSPCLMGMNDFGSFGWPNNDLMEMKARYSAPRDATNLTSDQGTMLFDHYMQKPSEGSLIDSTLQMIDVSGSWTKTISTTDWNQNLISGSGSSETNYQSPLVQENISSSRLNFRQESGILNSHSNQTQNEWSVKTFSLEGAKNSTNNELNQTNTTQGFSLDCSLPMTSSSYGYPSTLIENLFDDDQLPLENQPMNFPSTTNYGANLNEFSGPLENLPSLLSRPLPKQQEISPLHLTNNSSFWNASTATPSDITASTVFSSTNAPTIEKSNFRNLKAKSSNGVNQDSKKSSAEPAFKRTRIETPSPLPTFKVRKDKLGDHITALQQLVSPFGKNDTASVLQEAIEYIRFLHDQVNVLSTPYMKNGVPIQQQNTENSKDPQGAKHDLKSRGLCLVPISSTFPVANETTVDFWTPTFGGHSDREHIQTSLNNPIFCPYLV